MNDMSYIFLDMSPRSAAQYVRKKLKHDAAKRKKKRRRKKITGGIVL